MPYRRPSHGSLPLAKRLVIASNVVAAIAGLSNIIAGDQVINGFQLSWVFGSLTIVISILNMIQEKMAYASMATSFRQYSISWSVIHRKIEGELALPPASRKDCQTFLQSIRQDINQVSLSGNAQIPQHIRTACYNKFNNTPNFEIPEICGDMEHTVIYKSPDVHLISFMTSPAVTPPVASEPMKQPLLPPPTTNSATPVNTITVPDPVKQPSIPGPITAINAIATLQQSMPKNKR